jgi:acyl dehydratase
MLCALPLNRPEEHDFMMTTFETPADLANAVGEQLGSSDWVEITQERIDRFAEATGDFQWIHTDPERAKAGPFGKTIAHGYLTQSLASLFLTQVIDVQGIVMAINYGMDRVRFPAPAPVGSKLRGVGELTAAKTLEGGAVQATIRITVEIEDGDRPAAVVDTITRFLPG